MSMMQSRIIRVVLVTIILVLLVVVIQFLYVSSMTDYSLDPLLESGDNMVGQSTLIPSVPGVDKESANYNDNTTTIQAYDYQLYEQRQHRKISSWNFDGNDNDRHDKEAQGDNSTNVPNTTRYSRMPSSPPSAQPSSPPTASPPTGEDPSAGRKSEPLHKVSTR